MLSCLLLFFCALLPALVRGNRLHSLMPDKIFGANLGSWLVLEPWMLRGEWARMGGESCDANCSACIASEFAYAEAYPEKVDKEFDKHWSTWFSKRDVREIVDVGLNTVRIPLGYWIVESLVDRKTEFFPRGGLRHLRRGLEDLRDAGIAVILDNHAPAGVAAPNQMFAGRCTDKPEFYTAYNYHRTLIWTAVMTALSHLDPAFQSVFAIQAVNEQIMDARRTPGYGQFTKNFVLTIRAVEVAMGIPIKGVSTAKEDINPRNVTDGMTRLSKSSLFNNEVRFALREAVGHLTRIGIEYGLEIFHDTPQIVRRRESLVANFMDVNWQNNNPDNPADAKLGPQAYDNHLYYSFGGVADPNEEAYLTHICNLDRIEKDAALGNSPLWFGEWGLPTNFPATDEFLRKWADAQKRAYSRDAGWIFWNFKIEISEAEGDVARQWSYMEGVRRGYLTKNPAAYHDTDVCKGYIQTKSSS